MVPLGDVVAKFAQLGPIHKYGVYLFINRKEKKGDPLNRRVLLRVYQPRTKVEINERQSQQMRGDLLLATWNNILREDGVV